MLFYTFWFSKQLSPLFFPIFQRLLQIKEIKINRIHKRALVFSFSLSIVLSFFFLFPYLSFFLTPFLSLSLSLFLFNQNLSFSISIGIVLFVYYVDCFVSLRCSINSHSRLTTGLKFIIWSFCCLLVIEQICRHFLHNTYYTILFENLFLFLLLSVS